MSFCILNVPKHQWKFVQISALEYKKRGQIIKIKAHYNDFDTNCM